MINANCDINVTLMMMMKFVFLCLTPSFVRNGSSGPYRMDILLIPKRKFGNISYNAPIIFYDNF